MKDAIACIVLAPLVAAYAWLRVQSIREARCTPFRNVNPRPRNEG